MMHRSQLKGEMPLSTPRIAILPPIRLDYFAGVISTVNGNRQDPGDLAQTVRVGIDVHRFVINIPLPRRVDGSF